MSSAIAIIRNRGIQAIRRAGPYCSRDCVQCSRATGGEAGTFLTPPGYDIYLRLVHVFFLSMLISSDLHRRGANARAAAWHSWEGGRSGCFGSVQARHLVLDASAYRVQHKHAAQPRRRTPAGRTYLRIGRKYLLYYWPVWCIIKRPCLRRRARPTLLATAGAPRAARQSHSQVGITPSQAVEKALVACQPPVCTRPSGRSRGVPTTGHPPRRVALPSIRPQPEATHPVTNDR